MNISEIDFNFLVPQIISLAEQAGLLICQIYRQGSKIISKKDGSPVTQADQLSHLFLTERLKALTPHIPIISEEDEDSWTIKNPMYWLIDPLDGTKGFIEKTGEFCINIALIKENSPIFGLIHIPLTLESYYGYEKKAFYSYKGKATPLHTRSLPKKGMILLLGGYGKAYKVQEDLILNTYPIERIERLRSAIKFTRIASGKADLYVRFEPCSEWDTAAGQALIEAAGGVMMNLDNTPFIYGKTGLLNKGFIVFGTKP